MLRLFDIVVGSLEQLEDDVLDILAHVTRFGQRGGVGHGEGHVESPRQRLRQQRLAAAGRADEQDVRLREFDVARLARMLQPLVVVVHRDGEHALGAVLPDHVIVQRLEDFRRRGDIPFLLAGDSRLGLFTDDVVAQLDAFVADEHRRPGDELPHLVLGLAAKAAIQCRFAIGSGQLGHILSSPRNRLRRMAGCKLQRGRVNIVAVATPYPRGGPCFRHEDPAMVRPCNANRLSKRLIADRIRTYRAPARMSVRMRPGLKDHSGAPPEPSPPPPSFSGRVSKTLSTMPNSIASSASRKVSRSIAFSMSVRLLPVYLT